MKVLSCKDVGIECPFEARGKTEEEVIRQAIKHAREHGLEEKDITEDYLTSWRRKIHEE